MRAWVGRSGVVVGLMVTFWGPLGAATIELKSGDGAIGARDPWNEFSVNGGASFDDAYIIAGDIAYSTIPGTHWISASSDGRGGPQFSSNYLFQAGFQLPDGFESPTFSIQIHSDNSAMVLLNGFVVGEQPFDVMGVAGNFQGAPEVFSTTNPAWFRTGQNTLTIRVYDGLTPMGLDYSAIITFVPEPSAAVGLIAAGALGLICAVRRRWGKDRGKTARE